MYDSMYFVIVLGSEYFEVSVSSAKGGQQESYHICQPGRLHLIQVKCIYRYTIFNNLNNNLNYHHT